MPASDSDATVPGRGLGVRDEATIRRATVDDARAIATIGVLGWQAAYRGILPDGFLDRLSVDNREIAWRSALEAEEAEASPAWMAERGGEVVGFVSTGPPRDDDLPPSAVEVYAIYVLPSAWRTGAGRALLTTATDYWLARGASQLVLWVLEANDRGRAFYDALGWRPDGRRQTLEIGGDVAQEVRYRLVPHATAAPSGANLR